jgi:predicted amidophosphoribosyltransferase
MKFLRLLTSNYAQNYISFLDNLAFVIGNYLKNIERSKYDVQRQKEQQIRTIFCPNCRKKIPFDSNICPYCAYNLKVVQNQSKQSNITESQNLYCIYCGTELSIDSIFCSKCGKKV